MASADRGYKLLCPICQDIYTDSVTLRCGHNFCRDCIGRVLDTQDESGEYSCPECRATFRKCSPIQINIPTHWKTCELFLYTQRHQEEITGICCTYCVDSSAPAVRSCLHCEASLCDDHLRVHSKGAEHVLTDPSTSLKDKKCSIHKKILEYYCTEDTACICVSCSVNGEHWGHRVEMLDDASEKKKKKLKNVLQKLIKKRKESEERVRSLEEQWRKAQEKAAGEAERVTALCADIRRRVDDLEKRVLSDIYRREEKVSLSLSALIHQLEIKKDELSRKMRHIEELCNMTDPLTVLQDPDIGDLCDPEEEGGDEDTGGHDEGDEDTGGHDGGDEDTGGHDKTPDIDVDVITGMLHAGFSDIMTYLQNTSLTKQKEKRLQPPRVQSLPHYTQDLLLSDIRYWGDDVIVRTGGVGGKVMTAGTGGIYGEGPADILLDVNTAGNNLLISDDLKTATWTGITQNRPETAERFQDYPQVMSGRGFTSGRHYWDVEIRGSGEWRVGMCYPSIDRRGLQSFIDYNNKSWSLHRRKVHNNQCSVIHDSKMVFLSHPISSNRVRICLDYEAGQLSFYELCDPIRHLHTVTAVFSKPLHAVLYVLKGSIKILGGSSCGEP